MSTELTDKVAGILAKHPIPERNTMFQMERFVIGQEATVQGQIWQVIREMSARQEKVQTIRKQLDTAEDDLELYELKMERLHRRIRAIAADEKRTNGDLDIQELEIKIRKLERERKSLQASCQEALVKTRCIMEEMSFLAAIYDKLIKLIDTVKPLDDYHAQQELYDEKLLEDLHLRVLLQQRLDPAFIKTVMALDDGCTAKEQMKSLLLQAQHQVNRITQQNHVKAQPKVKG